MQLTDVVRCGPAPALLGAPYPLQDRVAVDSQGACCGHETALRIEYRQQGGALVACLRVGSCQVAELCSDEGSRCIQVARDGVNQSDIGERGDRRRSAPRQFDYPASPKRLQMGGAKACSAWMRGAHRDVHALDIAGKAPSPCRPAMTSRHP